MLDVNIYPRIGVSICPNCGSEEDFLNIIEINRKKVTVRCEQCLLKLVIKRINSEFNKVNCYFCKKEASGVYLYGHLYCSGCAMDFYESVAEYLEGF